MINNVAFANAIVLKKGQAAPFDGILLSNATANKAKTDSLENEVLKKKNALLIDINNLQQKNSDIDAEKIKALSQQNDVLAKNNEASREFHNWERVLYIGLGVLAAGVGAMAVSKASH